MNNLSRSSRWALCAALAVLAALPAWSRPLGRGRCDRGGACACVEAAASTEPIILGEAARAALLFQIEEERMARELYTAFHARWGLRPFDRIPPAEARHEEALRALAARAGLTVPAAAPGKFESTEVQARYDTLLARGQQSAEAALQAAAFVEEQDIADLRGLAAAGAADSAPLKQLVAGLEQASGHHLAAFARNLRMRGFASVPQVLPAPDFAALTADQGARGGSRRNRGG